MIKLLFPVKPMLRSAGIVAVLVLAACGYRPAFDGPRPVQKLSLEAAPPRVAEMDALRGVLAGARIELSRFGVLAETPGFPRMIVELTRIDERPAGITAQPSLGGGSLVPLARGSTVAVVGRAWVQGSAGAEPSRDTGDMRRSEGYASAEDARREASYYDDAVRAAADELGRALARRVLGLPEPTEEPL